MNKKTAIVIGSGMAGLAAAIRLQNQNFNVLVLESNTTPGGKVTEFKKNGYRFDCGPSLFTMPQFIEELFESSRKDISKYLNYVKKEKVCNYFYEDRTRFTAFADKNKFAQEASSVFDVKASQILKYFEKSKQKYDLTSSIFLSSSLHKFSTYFSKDTLKAIAKIGVLDIDSTLHKVNTSAYKDPRLVQFFDRFATYNGSSPYKTPGIMSMIPHLEQHYGTFFPQGGMYSITKSLYQLALDLGAKFRFNTTVDQIVVENKKAKGVLIKDEYLQADIVVSNMDIVPTYQKMLPDQKHPNEILKQSRSSSALIFYWGIKRVFSELELHNVFFAKEYKDEFDAIFNKKEVSKDPTVYINISSKNEPNDAPDGCENWFVMINVPCNENQDWDTIIEMSRQHILKKISRILKVDIRPLIETEEILNPKSIESKTQSYKGSLYGSSSNNKYAAFLRHANFSGKIKNLYFCGGSVHPGGGIPLCLLSGKIVSELVQKDFKK
ncbi:phytoene desaturase [Aquimarina sp. AD10]|uniref:1-hydroxycarotenoid 3,4-desaturase CrtD n=1 Tax=Aquimarina sp. AD10 TaxID=1714849 RepID=UPI000E46A03B|nr:1-hydroxycarotenoid 3,4-desaturase CrtD [Aquimarina sp. AD10]AXT61534.1 phytoene desaturase [Aquimarina sp. AD10]RKM90017.1 phytoene desaturase [Aquimarina sp. AD10]